MSITSFDYAQIINQLCPDSLFNIVQNNYTTLVWNRSNSFDKPSESEIIAKNTEMINILAYEELRSMRNSLLNESDKYSLLDYPHPNDNIRTQWLTYRNDLRNITTQTPILNIETLEISGITWPTPP